jgi:Uma2 family endonuclease
MTALAQPPPPVAQAASITSDEFFAMIEAGIFERRSVFLWGGRIYERMSKSILHAGTATLIHDALTRRLPPGWCSWVENPLQVNAEYAPLPDLMIVRGSPRDYLAVKRHPTPADIGLLVEIAVTSLPKDLETGARLWASAGVAQYWVADVPGRRIISHRGPGLHEGAGRYAHVMSYAIGETLPLVLDGSEVDQIPVEQLLP